MNKLDVVLKNSLEELQRATGEIDAFLEQIGASGETVFNVHFVVEEMLSNVIKYAFKDSSQHEILLEITSEKKDLRIVIEDDGMEFNPLSVPEKKTDLPLQEREIGGLGIHLVRKIARDMTYLRRNGRNRLEMSLLI